MKVLKILPYVITVIVLIITSIVGKKGVQPPSSLGQSYFREER
jgi:simple sugar transport system permease protein